MKKYLKEIGISGNDAELDGFITGNKTVFDDYFRQKWDEYQKNIPETEKNDVIVEPETPVETVAESTDTLATIDNNRESGETVISGNDAEPDRCIPANETVPDDYSRQERDEYSKNIPETEENGVIEKPETPVETVAESTNTLGATENNRENGDTAEKTVNREKSENPQKKGAEDYREENARNEVFSNQIRSKHVTIPNGKVNQNYTFHFDMEKIIPEIGEFSFEGLNEIGLDFNPETKEIKGIPKEHGEFQIKMKCKRNDWKEGKPVFERNITFIVNPDPKSLWKDIPTPENIKYYKPDCDTSFVKVEPKEKTEPRKNMVAASRRGRSHAHEGKPRDDDFALSFNEDNEWYIMTVADGAGSAKYSRRGSQIACQTVLAVCGDAIRQCLADFEQAISTFHEDKSQKNRNEVGKLLYGIIGTAAFKSYKNIEKEALEEACHIRDYSTTLIVSVCKKFSFGWFVGAFWVGDGGIGIYRKEPQYLKVLGESDGGEFAGQTRFLTMSEIIQPAELYRRLRFDIVDDFTALILMTDGISDPKFETDANLLKIEKWDGLWEDLSGEMKFEDDKEDSASLLLDWLNFWSPGNHDDRTIAILF
jgi:serine/threonine protein phosphatase PrpC